MIIDSHIHISLYNGNAKNLQEAFDLYLDEMKKNNIKAAIIIPDNIENSLGIADLRKAAELKGNRTDLFLLGSPQIIQRGASELEKYSKLLREKIILGLKFFPGHDPYCPNDPRCLPYYDLCEKENVPVVFHTGANPGDEAAARWNDPKYIVEIANKYPALKIVIAHYYWPQMDYCYEATKNAANIYFETAAMADEEVLESSGGINKVRGILLKTIEDRPNKVIFGTDWPMCKIEDHIKLIKSLCLGSRLENQIYCENSKLLYNFNPENPI